METFFMGAIAFLSMFLIGTGILKAMESTDADDKSPTFDELNKDNPDLI